MWEGAIPMWLWGAASECVRVLNDNWSLQQHSSPSPGWPGWALILYISKRTNCTCFMRPLEHLDEGAAQLSISFFHQVTKRLYCSLIISEPLLHQLLCKPWVIMKLLKQLAVSASPPSAQEQWRSQTVTSPRSGHLQCPYCSCCGPHLQRGWLSEGTQIRLCSAYSCRWTWVAPWCTTKCWESKYLDIMFFSTNQKMFIIRLICRQ